VTPDALNGDTRATRTQKNPKEPKDDDLVDLPIRESGESWAEYLGRVAEVSK
jgi:hypothetical protein